jgi:hypothetical protein
VDKMSNGKGIVDESPRSADYDDHCTGCFDDSHYIRNKLVIAHLPRASYQLRVDDTAKMATHVPRGGPVVRSLLRSNDRRRLSRFATNDDRTTALNAG